MWRENNLLKTENNDDDDADDADDDEVDDHNNNNNLLIRHLHDFGFLGSPVMWVQFAWTCMETYCRLCTTSMFVQLCIKTLDKICGLGGPQDRKNIRVGMGNIATWRFSMEKNVLISQSRKAIGSQELRIRMLAIGFKPRKQHGTIWMSMCIHIVKSIGRFLGKKVVPTHSKQLGLLNTIDLRGRTSAHFTIYKRNILFKYQSDFAHTWAGVKKLRDS